MSSTDCWYGCGSASQVPAGLYKEIVWCGRFVVAASSIEGGLKMNSEGISSLAGGQFGSGTLEESGMVSSLVLTLREPSKIWRFTK